MLEFTELDKQKTVGNQRFFQKKKKQ